jgi:hypothetical protein
MESDELRNQMREHLAIRESIHKDTEAFTPPPASRKAVWAAIGLNPGAVANAPITQIAVQTGFWGGFWSKVWVPVVSAVVATLVTSLLFLNFYDTGGQSGQPVKSLNKIPVVSSNENIQPEKKIRNNNASANPSAPGVQRKVFRINTAPVMTATDDNTISQEIVQGQTENINPIEIAQLDNSNMKFNMLTQSVVKNNNIPLVKSRPNKLLIVSPNKLSELDITLILRGISATSFPNVDAPPGGGKPVFSNFGIGGYVTVVDGLDVGLEVGQENFGQEFYNMSKGELQIIPQNPIIFWAGLNVKGKYVNGIDFLAGAKPYTQLFIGGTVLGPLAKLTGGLEYRWDNGFGILIGIEGGTLLYNNQGTWYSTEKLGFTYGMLYNF